MGAQLSEELNEIKEAGARTRVDGDTIRFPVCPDEACQCFGELTVEKGLYHRENKFCCSLFECNALMPLNGAGIAQYNVCYGACTGTRVQNLGMCLLCTDHSEFTLLKDSLVTVQNTGEKGSKGFTLESEQCMSCSRVSARANDGVVDFTKSEGCGCFETRALIPIPLMAVYSENMCCGLCTQISASGGGVGFKANAPTSAFEELKAELEHILSGAEHVTQRGIERVPEHIPETVPKPVAQQRADAEYEYDTDESGEAVQL